MDKENIRPNDSSSHTPNGKKIKNVPEKPKKFQKARNIIPYKVIFVKIEKIYIFKKNKNKISKINKNK